MKNIDSTYVAIGASWLVLGMMLGIVMGATNNFQFMPLHAHINLIGFACHAIFGMAYRHWPMTARSRTSNGSRASAFFPCSSVADLRSACPPWMAVGPGTHPPLILLRLENPKIRGIYDAKVVGDGIAINTPVSRHLIA
jgi:hypothetical protein